MYHICINFAILFFFYLRFSLFVRFFEHTDNLLFIFKKLTLYICYFLYNHLIPYKTEFQLNTS